MVTTSFTLINCSSEENATEDFETVSEDEAERIKSLLEERSFRKAFPETGMVARDVVMISFFQDYDSAIRVRGQVGKDYYYSSDEWEIRAADFKISKGIQSGNYKLEFIGITTEQFLPDKCNNCMKVSSFNLILKTPFEEVMTIKVESEPQLPPPLPIFTSWTIFDEDNIIY